MTTLWERVKTGGKTGFDKTWKTLDKVGAPVNRLSNKLGSEAFWPTTLNKECDKAARILKSFCRDGFYAEEEFQSQEGPKHTQKVVKKIPAQVIQNAKGLAIFTTMRTGLWFSGAGGSGILIAKKENGSWSPPSGILLHTAGLGFMVGIDIYDCVVVINTTQALEAFYKVRCTLGSEISVAAGPVGAGGVLETELHKRQAPIFTYMKSRGFYAGVQIDGTVIIERTDENERFYGQRIAVKDILAGQVRHPPFEVNRLLETIKAAQGQTFDEAALPTEPPPSDIDVDDGHVFGVPDKEDPDPYGVLALEKAGMRVVEAGTKERATWEQFSFNPSPTSPVHTIYNRQSVDFRRPLSTRSSWRGSLVSATPTAPVPPPSLRQSIEMPKKSSMVDSSTQTELDSEPLSPNINGWRNEIVRRSSRGSVATSTGQQTQNVPEDTVLETHTPPQHTGYTTPPTTPPPPGKDEPDSDHEVEIVQPVVHSVQTIKPATTQVVSKARLVTVAKRVPPRLPARNPRRANDASPGKEYDEMPLSPRHTEDKTPETLSSPELSGREAAEIPLSSRRTGGEVADITATRQQPGVKASGEPSLSQQLYGTPAEMPSPPLVTVEDTTSSPEHEFVDARATPASDEAKVNKISTTDHEHLDRKPHNNSNSLKGTDPLPLITDKLEDVDLEAAEHDAKRSSTMSNQSNSSSTWDKVRAMRAIDDDD